MHVQAESTSCLSAPCALMCIAHIWRRSHIAIDLTSFYLFSFTQGPCMTRVRPSAFAFGIVIDVLTRMITSTGSALLSSAKGWSRIAHGASILVLPGFSNTSMQATRAASLD